MGVEPGGVSGVPWPLLRAAGVAVPLVRELVDIRHQWDAPFVLDSAETTEVFGLAPTPWDDVVRATAGAAATPV